MSTPQKRKRKKQDPKDSGNNYVDNKELFAEMVEWKSRCNDAENVGDERPPMTDSIGQKIILIAEGVARSKNFCNYSYKDEMISDGIENCIRYGHNFDPEKSENPFSYFSQMIYFAFLRRIDLEKKQANIRKKCIEMAIDDPQYKHDTEAGNTSSAGALSEMQKKLSVETSEYDEYLAKKNKRGKKAKKEDESIPSHSSSSSNNSLY